MRAERRCSGRDIPATSRKFPRSELCSRKTRHYRPEPVPGWRNPSKRARQHQFLSPFRSFDLRLQKQILLSDGVSFSLIAEGFNMFNTTNIRGASNDNYAGRNFSIGPYQAAQNGQPAQAVQENFYSAVTTAGGFFGSGGPRAFRFAVRFAF